MTVVDGPILVMGATGRQGGATARELLKRGHQVHAFTRSLDTPAAQQLAADGASLVHGDLDDPDTVRQAMQDVAAVFSVQAITSGLDVEARQALTAVDAAHAAGVGHVVYSSVDGAERSSGVPHFESKWQVEQRLHELGIPTTVLRPVFFIDNFADHVAPQQVDGELVVRLALREDKPLQMIATADIGVFAADAIEQRDTHVGISIALAGDELTGSQIAAALQEASGMQTRFETQPIDEVRAFSSDMALMFEWINDLGYDHADIPALRRQHPGLRTLRDWLSESDWRPAARSISV
ncbi:MAG: NmrA/HSCARG family protein [Actinomycetota bacterium]|nr:NmrA/HSCARG family protein [Actinomycetota bacterium]